MTNSQKVSFNDSPSFMTLEPLSKDERQVRWYTSKDFETMRKLNQSDDSSSSSSSTGITVTPATTAGITTTTTDLPTSSCKSCTTAADERLHSEDRRAFVHGLLAQQYEHQMLGLKDPKGLFQFSRAASKQSRLRAIRIAKEDAKEAHQIINELKESIDAVLDLLDTDCDFP